MSTASSTHLRFQYPSAARAAREILLQRIGRQWHPGDRLPPIRQLTIELGIGQGSVNAAVKQLVREGRLVSRPKLGTYVVDHGVDSSSPIANKCIAIYQSTRSDGMIQIMADAIGQVLAPRGARLTTHEYAAPKRGSDCQLDGDADAIIMINPGPYPQVVVRDHQYMLFIQTAAENPLQLPLRYFDEVTIDQEMSAAIAGEHLRLAGCHEACFLGVWHQTDKPRRYNLTSHKRLTGFEAGFGKPLPDAHRLAYISFGEGSGARLAGEYAALSPRPEGVFAASDELAVGFVKGTLALGMEPGRDYQLIGFDGQERAIAMEEGPITTIQVPADQLGRRGAQLLIDRFGDPDQPTQRLQLGCKLFEGKTTRT